MALPRPLRFPGRRDIQTILRRGRRISVPLGQAVWSPASAGRGRTLFVVAKAVLKKSSDRNRLKRRLDEWLQHRYGARPPKAHSVVFVGLPAASVKASLLWQIADQTFAAIERAAGRR